MVAMETPEVAKVSDFGCFKGFSSKCKHGIGRVIHQNDRLVRPYQDQKKIFEKIDFGCHGNLKTAFFGIFERFWLISCRCKHGIGRVIHQNDRLGRPYQEKNKKNEKKYFACHDNLNTVIFFVIFGQFLRVLGLFRVSATME